MKILFFGDSITDCGRDKAISDNTLNSYGYGFVRDIAGALNGKDPLKYQILNRGISGNRIVDLYARIKSDVWNNSPDVLSILIGVNDVWHEVEFNNGVDLKRYENIYRLILTETKERLPNIKIIICEPFTLKGKATETKFEEFSILFDYAKVCKKLAEEFNCEFLPLQNKLDYYAEKYGDTVCLTDGVHPAPFGAKLIADEWLKLFNDKN